MVQEWNANLGSNVRELFDQFGANGERRFLHCAGVECRRKRDEFGSDLDRGQSANDLDTTVEPNGERGFSGHLLRHGDDWKWHA